MPRKKPDTSMSPEAIDSNIANPDDYWLPPRAAAAILGISEKWLANAREGRSGIEGPPFIKLGTGRTAPIRYNLGRLKDWLKQFPERVDLAGRQSSLRSFAEFKDRLGTPKALDDRWLFAIGKEGPMDFFEALKSGALDSDDPPDCLWLSLLQWTKLAIRPTIDLGFSLVMKGER